MEVPKKANASIESSIPSDQLQTMDRVDVLILADRQLHFWATSGASSIDMQEQSLRSGRIEAFADSSLRVFPLLFPRAVGKASYGQKASIYDSR
jgi:hypothetical protein